MFQKLHTKFKWLSDCQKLDWIYGQSTNQWTKSKHHFILLKRDFKFFPIDHVFRFSVQDLVDEVQAKNGFNTPGLQLTASINLQNTNLSRIVHLLINCSVYK